MEGHQCYRYPYFSPQLSAKTSARSALKYLGLCKITLPRSNSITAPAQGQQKRRYPAADLTKIWHAHYNRESFHIPLRDFPTLQR